MFSSPGQCHFVWSSVRSRKVRRVMDCGGKRSATPLFAHAESFRLKPRARPRESAVAAPALPAHSTTICALGSASANPPAAGGASGGTAGRGKIRARPGLGAKHPPPQSAGQTIRTATKNSFSFSARLRTKYRGSPAGLLTLFCHLLNPRAVLAWGERGPSFGFTPRSGCGWFSASPGVVARRSRPTRPKRQARL